MKKVYPDEYGKTTINGHKMEWRFKRSKSESIFGIRGSRIFELEIKRDGIVTAEYGRGWAKLMSKDDEESSYEDDKDASDDSSQGNKIYWNFDQTYQPKADIIDSYMEKKKERKRKMETEWNITTNDVASVQTYLPPFSDIITRIPALPDISATTTYSFTNTNGSSTYNLLNTHNSSNNKKDNKNKKDSRPNIPKNYDPVKIIQNGPATIIFWKDGTKTIVRKAEASTDDPYVAFCAALAKKVYGNNSRIKKLINKNTQEQKKRKDEK